MATEHAIAGGAPAARTDWQALARRTWRTRFTGQSALFAFLVAVSVPIILPYFWMVVIAFTARTGGVGSDVLWTACAVIVPNGFGDRGLPTSLQLRGRAWEENTILAAARAYQALTDWHHRHPSVL